LRIGVLTAGGDAPGLNAAIRAIGQMALRDGHEVIGIATAGPDWPANTPSSPPRERPPGVIAQGGTLLGTARYNLDSPAGGRERVLAAIDEHLDALISWRRRYAPNFDVAADHGAPIVGVPKTLDNDLLAPTTASALTPRSASCVNRSTGSTRRRRRITASWSSRRWDA